METIIHQYLSMVPLRTFQWSQLWSQVQNQTAHYYDKRTLLGILQTIFESIHEDLQKRIIDEVDLRKLWEIYYVYSIFKQSVRFPFTLTSCTHLTVIKSCTRVSRTFPQRDISRTCGPFLQASLYNKLNLGAVFLGTDRDDKLIFIWPYVQKPSFIYTQVSQRFSIFRTLKTLGGLGMRLLKFVTLHVNTV